MRERWGEGGREGGQYLNDLVSLGGIEGGRAKGGDRSDLQTLGPIVKDGKGGGGWRGWGKTLRE
jgi:hypothetical protein